MERHFVVPRFCHTCKAQCFNDEWTRICWPCMTFYCCIECMGEEAAEHEEICEELERARMEEIDRRRG